MVVAFVLHLAAVVATLAAPFAFQSAGKNGAYWCLFVGQFLFSLGNGTTEAVVNPLTATLFPRNKTHYLNILHAGWPGGLVLGALPACCSTSSGWPGGRSSGGWCWSRSCCTGPDARPAVPGVRGQGVRHPARRMVATCSPRSCCFLFLLHALVGYVELGTDSWIVDITKNVLQSSTNALLAFIWTNVLMFTLRFFAGRSSRRSRRSGCCSLAPCSGWPGCGCSASR
jgi:MFS family permease